LPAKISSDQGNDLVFELLWIDRVWRGDEPVYQRFDGSHDNAGAESTAGTHRRVAVSSPTVASTSDKRE
jgi:hypothetical protein